jgi:hypothetical protein
MITHRIRRGLEAFWNDSLKKKLKAITISLFAIIATSCGGVQVNLESNFPTPLLEGIPLHVGIVLTEELRNFTYEEEISGDGQFTINIGGAQKNMFSALGKGVFKQATILEELKTQEALDAILLPEIDVAQIATPKQTRSEYFEVWVRYKFNFYDNEANLVGTWNMPAYGKANQNDYPSKNATLRAAGISACRDAIAFFSLNFQSNRLAQRWFAGERGTPGDIETERLSDKKSVGNPAQPTQDGTTQQKRNPPLESSDQGVKPVNQKNGEMI